MRNLRLARTVPLQLECSAITSDGHFFYICQDNKPIVHRVDMQGNIISSIPVKHRLKSICYDSSDDCFWGLAYDRPRKIIMLSEDWEEFDAIGVASANTVLNHITYDEKSDSFLLNSYLALYRISKDGTILSKHDNKPKQMCMASVPLEDDVLIVSNSMFASQDIISLASSEICDESTTSLPVGHRCSGICLERQSTGELTAYLLTRKDSEPYLLEYQSLPEQSTRPEYIPDTVQYDVDEMVCIQEIII